MVGDPEWRKAPWLEPSSLMFRRRLTSATVRRAVFLRRVFGAGGALSHCVASYLQARLRASLRTSLAIHRDAS
jgi:hypothetical protein